ncbi:MAG TPA: ABC transporter substrate-binding protein [Verrucomicrobiota bacterium]|nr:ABC transporter substrate-binding protein [Verrucomicrobiota bacterium]HQL77865.1 ABC transporter substrate-binding protein [Verrucomicrobiota bacterium]
MKRTAVVMAGLCLLGTLLVMAGLCLLGTLLFTSSCAPPPSAEPVKIGALFSVTGPASFLGAPEEKTVQMLVEQINAAGGINGQKLQLVVKDTAGSPEKAVSFAKQLIEEEKVLAIIGPSTSGETMAIKDLCQENKMLLVSCAAAETIVNPVAKYVFKVPQKDSQAVTWIYRTMKEKGISNIAIVSSTDGYGAAGKKQLEDLAPAEGITILANEVYDKQATDLTDVLTKIKGNSSVQAVVNWSIVPAQSIVAKNMKQLGLNVPLFQSHGFGNLKYVQQAGVAAEGILFPASRLLIVEDLPDGHPQKEVLATYKKDYESRYKEEVSTFGGHSYDALMVVVEALKKAGEADREKVRDALETLTGFVGTAGVFNFSATDHTGLDLTAFEMLTVKDGKFVMYKK